MNLHLQLKLEEAVGFLAALAAWHLVGQPLWLFAALFLLPDLGMIGYLAGPRLGAFTYNVVHHKGLGLALAVAGLFLPTMDWLLPTGILLYGHASFDRLFGYGLKAATSFHDTYLGRIGRQR